ncbi:hypothetical protein ACIQ6Y_33785 [Streptomyces sp. NPDC096205]|uniref:hypothetical protein n=1 Tax=Streptomyces sp. NPDC096205 TaxID=3366081 RepID=UPI0038153D16
MPSAGDGGTPSGEAAPDGGTTGVDLHRSVRSFALIGGLGGAAAVLTAVALLLGKSPVDWFGDSAAPSPTTSSPTEPSTSAPGTTPPAAVAASRASAVTIQQPTTHDGEQVDVEQCQEFRGTARLADGFTLWLAGHTKADPRYALYTEASVSPATGRWTATAQLGGPGEAGQSFEVVAVAVPADVADYLRGITDSNSRQLLQNKDGTGSSVGLFNPALPPGSDTGHSDTVTVRRAEAPPNC